MRIPHPQIRRLFAAAALAVLGAALSPAASAAAAQGGAAPGVTVSDVAQDESTLTTDALLRVQSVFELVGLTGGLWPGWDITRTPFALTCPDGYCYLVNHPRPPAGFEPLDTPPGFNGTVARSRADAVAPGWPCMVEGVATAYCEFGAFSRAALPALVGSAFRAHGAVACAEAVRPIDLLSGYPLDSGNLVLADIECILLKRAVEAPADSLALRAREFASVRRHRRLRVGGRYAEYERRLEFSEGIPAYIAERCRREALEHPELGMAERLGEGMGRPLEPGLCLSDTLGLDWYKRGRFAWTGAHLCMVMDRLYPEWKKEAAVSCADPYDVMLDHLGGRMPPAREVLNRFGYEERLARKASEIEGAKGAAERLFEEITRGRHRVIAVNTHLLASGEISFDPTQIEKVDAHRQVHKRFLKVEYSLGTHFYAVGMPVAVVLGDDEFDVRSLIVAAPDRYSVTLDGEPLDVVEGVYQFERSLLVEAEGLSVVAMAGTVLVGDHGITLVLHR